MTYQPTSLKTIVDKLKCRVIQTGDNFNDAIITFIAASDLMSDVLVVDRENILIITSLNSDQVVRTADIVGATAILLVNGKHPQDRMKELAKESGLTLLSTDMSCFEACLEIGALVS